MTYDVKIGGMTMFQNWTYDSVPQRYTFEIHDVDVSIVNAIRRTILTDIPVVGLLGEGDASSVEIVTNTGPLHNEFMEHRIGLIPMHLTEEEVEAFMDDQYTVELEAKNTTNVTINVTTHQFKVWKDEKPLPEKEVQRIFKANHITNQPIMITRLRPGEALHIKAKPVKSTARTHAGFAPVSLCTFSYLVDPVRSTQAQGILDKERAFKVKNEYGDPAGMVFEIESECGLTPKYLVSKALEMIMDRLKKLSSLDAIVAKATQQGMEYTFKDEDDTLGNLLQTYMFQKYIREKKLAPSGEVVSYVGYYCPHPLDATMIIRIFIKDDKDPGANQEAYRNILQDAIREVDMQLQIIQQNWGSFTQGK